MPSLIHVFKQEARERDVKNNERCDRMLLDNMQINSYVGIIRIYRIDLQLCRSIRVDLANVIDLDLRTCRSRHPRDGAIADVDVRPFSVAHNLIPPRAIFWLFASCVCRHRIGSFSNELTQPPAFTMFLKKLACAALLAAAPSVAFTGTPTVARVSSNASSVSEGGSPAHLNFLRNGTEQPGYG